MRPPIMPDFSLMRAARRIIMMCYTMSYEKHYGTELNSLDDSFRPFIVGDFRAATA
jgi:hypothetical protein